MKGKDAIQALRKKLHVNSDLALAERLGITETSIQRWKNRPSVTALQFAGLVHSAANAATKRLEVTAISPLVEFYYIQRSNSIKRANFELFDVKDEEGREHPFRVGLKRELSDSFGVYIFFDSRGRAIYTGKAKRQSLWKEMKSAFNRDRSGSVQSIKRVNHPTIRVDYKPSDEISRQIVDFAVPLYELAAYFSAYKVVDGMIDELEALLVRSFANDLLNIRMENFSGHGRGSK